MTQSRARPESDHPIEHPVSGQFPAPSQVRLRASTSNENDAAFAAALRTVRDAPESVTAWDELEQLCEALQTPEPVAEAYLRMLTPGRSEAVRELLARRAIAFHDCWFGGDQKAMQRVLDHVIETCPEAGWAFDELVGLLTASEQWQALLEAYDRALAGKLSITRRRQLLDDAAHVAKDFTHRPERAIDYLRELLKLDPTAHAPCASLERVLTEHGRWSSLIELWQAQLDAAPTPPTGELRLRIARVCLEQLAAPAEALAQASSVLEQRPGDDQACSVLEQVLSLDTAPAELRHSALHLLRLHHDSADRPLATIAALERSLGFAVDPLQSELRRELAQRFLTQGDCAAATIHYAELLRRDAGDGDARVQLALLAERSGDHAAHARALVSAADAAASGPKAAALLLAAMGVCSDKLDEREAGIELGQRVLKLEGAEPTQVRDATEALERMLRGTDRNEDLLSVLDRLVSLEQSPYRRRLLYSEIAMRAQDLGKLERAICAWQAWLGYDDTDLEALTNTIELAAKLEWHQIEIEHLRQRAEHAQTPRQRRQDRTRIASLQATKLEDLDSAIDTWLSVREEFGDEPDVLSSLDALMSERGRFSELARLLDGATCRERDHSLARLCRLGDVYRVELEDHGAAARVYARALELDARCEPARAGLCTLLSIKNCAQEVTTALERAYIATDDWQLRIDLLDARVAAAVDPAQQAACMLEVAALCEQRAGDPARALSLVAKALPRLPHDVQAERELLRLAEATNQLREAATALHWAAAAASPNRERAADLSALEGRLLERLNEPKRAAEAYELVLAVRPSAQYEAHALVRNAAEAGALELACETAMHSCAVRHAVEPEVLESLGTAAARAGSYVPLRNAFAGALRRRTDLSKVTASELELELAAWCMLDEPDAGAAEDAARRALAHQPHSVRCMQVLAAAQRLTASHALFDTLLAIDAHSPNTIEPLIEAAQRLDELKVDVVRQRATLTRLFRRAAELWTLGETTFDCERWVLWALDQVLPLELAAAQPTRALALLDDAVRLPIQETKRAELRRKSAHILEREGQLSEALQLGLAVLSHQPNDLALVTWLAELAARLDRVPDQLALRTRQLALSESADARLPLRLEIVRLTGLLEGRDARLAMLIENLDEHAGHSTSLDAACALLRSQHRLPELLTLLSLQAKALADANQVPLATSLWHQAAQLAEHELLDREQAISALEKVAALVDDPSVVDELVRLSRALDDAARTAHWLNRRLSLAKPPELARLRLELAKAQLAAQQTDAALATLQHAFAEAPSDVAVRELLTEHLRTAEQRSELAEVLAKAAAATADPTESAALAIESARLYHAAGEAPEALVAIADLALGLKPDDAELCGIMADGLRALGRFEEARQVLLYLLAQFGRRRSAERAQVHVKLAAILHDERDLAGSCAQLELALSMRSSDVEIMLALAERAEEAEDLPRRERALRALLLAAKRETGIQTTEHAPGVSEILLQLSEVARARGDADQANSLSESALEALRFGDPECERIKQRLLASEANDLLEQVLRQELAHAVGYPERSAAMGALADLLEARSETREEAISLRLSAVELDPADPRLHDAAQKACTPDHLPRFRALLDGLRARTRRPGDSYARCEVCLRLASLAMQANDLDAARLHYAEAEATQVRESDVWRGQLKIAVTREDVALQATLLSKLDSLGGAELGNEERVDVLYRLAEVRLGAEDTRGEGLSRLREAMIEAPRPVRAARLLLRVMGECSDQTELQSLFSELTFVCSAQQLLQISELCIEEGNDDCLAALIERAFDRDTSPSLRAALLVRRVRSLLAKDAKANEAGELLRRAMELDPNDAEIETLLVTYYEEAADTERLVDHLVARAERARDMDDADACIRYALDLDRHVEEERAADAVQALREAMRRAPHRNDLRAALLARLRADEHAHERAEVLEQLLAHTGGSELTELALEAAALYETCGEGVSAVRVLRLAREHAPRQAEPLGMLIEVFRRQDDAEALADALAESGRLETDPERRAACLRESAELRRARLDDADGAIALFEEAVQNAPHDASLRRELAVELLSNGRVDEATEALARAAAHGDTDEERAELLCLRGKTLLDHQRIDAGLACLEEAFAIAPRDLVASLLQALDGARLRAVEDGDTASASRLTLHLASKRRALGELREAAALIEAHLSRVTASDEELALLVEIYAEIDAPIEHARALSLRLSRADESLRAELAEQLGVLIPRLTDCSEVRDALQKAHASLPNVQEIEDAWMMTLAATGDDLSLARALMAKSQRQAAPELRAQCLSRAVQHFFAAGAAAEATDVLFELQSAGPEDVDTSVALADALLSQQRLDEARALLEGLVDPSVEGHSPSRARLLLRLSQVAQAQGDHHLALSAMQAARDADTSNRTVLAQLAVLAEELEAWAVAENALTSVLLLKGPEVMPRGEALLRRARVAIHHSGPKRALLWARKALEAAPDSEDAAQLIRRLEAERG